MTAKRDLKRLVRDRQAKTGERYTTALHHVLAQRPNPPFSVVELVDLSADAAKLGFRCRVSMFPALAERVDAADVLLRIRDVLFATEGDPATARLRAVVLRGEPLISGVWPSGFFEEGRRFMARARAGLGGVSESGRMLAMHLQGRHGLETVIGLLWQLPIPLLAHRDPCLTLTTPDGFVAEYTSLGVELMVGR